MKKIFTLSLCFIMAIVLSGCTGTKSKDSDGNEKKEFSFGETATVNNTKITLNSIKKIQKECNFEYEGTCHSYNEPENDYFLLIDLTIENTGDKELNISSVMSFDLKDKSGERGKYAFLTKSISSQLDGEVMSKDLLKGQIAFDVKESDNYYFYYKDSPVDSNIKFTINKSDITE